MVRINKFLAQNGIASRRKVEELILNGEVVVNGIIVQNLATQINPEKDKVSCGGKKITPAAVSVLKVYALNKPRNCVTTMEDPENRDQISQYFPHTKERLFPVGRLDYQSEGLIFITNDGNFANQVLHPKNKIRKKYFVKIKGILSKTDLIKVNGKRTLEGKQIQKIKTSILHMINDKTWLEVVLTEGKNRQIRKVFAAFNYRVLKIKRFKIGNIDLGMLQSGECRLLGKEEVSNLLKLCSGQ